MMGNVSTYKISWNIEKISHLLLKCMLCISMLEIMLYPSIDTLYAICVSLVGTAFCKKFVLTASNLLYYPVSTLAISFYTFFFMIMPMPATLLEFKPVTYNLHNSIDTYSNLLILEITLILIHFFYRQLVQKDNFIRTVFFKCHFFRQFSASEIWLLILGSSCIYTYNILNRGLYDENAVQTTSSLPIGIYILNLLIGGYYQIIFIFLFRKFNVIKQPYNIHKVAIFLLSVVLFLVGIASNMRTASIIVFANGFFLFIIYMIYFPVNYQKFLKPKIIIPVLCLIFFFFGPFMDISKAMLINRGERYGVDGMEMLSKTFDTLQDEDNSFLENKKTNGNGKILWDEEYLSNDILKVHPTFRVIVLYD